MPYNNLWLVSAHDIAQSFATYFSKEDASFTYQEYYDICIDSNFELINWAQNGMSWEDMKKYADTMVGQGDIDWQKEWINSKKQISDLIK